MPNCAIPDANRQHLIAVLEQLMDIPGVDEDYAVLSACSPCGTALKITGKATPVNGDKPKRAPSAYQEFIGDCMRAVEKGGQGRSMKECVVVWNDLKKKGQAPQKISEIRPEPAQNLSILQ